MNRPMQLQATGSKKADLLKATALQLFTKHGIKRISVEEICKTANVSKMTFYKYYENKTVLVKIIVREMMEVEIHEMEKLDKQPISFKEKFEKMFQFEMKLMNSFSEEFINEITVLDKELHDFMTDTNRQISNQMISFFKNAQEKGEIRQDLSIDFIHYLIHHLFAMFCDPELIQLFPIPQKRMEQMFIWFFRSLDP